MQTFLSKYVKLIKKLDSRIKKNIDTKDTTCDELKTQLETLNQSFRTLHKENEELTQKLLYTQNKLQQVSSENQKESAAKVTEMAEKLKVNAFFVKGKMLYVITNSEIIVIITHLLFYII